MPLSRHSSPKYNPSHPCPQRRTPAGSMVLSESLVTHNFGLEALRFKQQTARVSKAMIGQDVVEFGATDYLPRLV